jgi:hypothetical protein
LGRGFQKPEKEGGTGIENEVRRFLEFRELRWLDIIIQDRVI